MHNIGAFYIKINKYLRAPTLKRNLASLVWIKKKRFVLIRKMPVQAKCMQLLLDLSSLWRPIKMPRNTNDCILIGHKWIIILHQVLVWVSTLLSLKLVDLITLKPNIFLLFIRKSASTWGTVTCQTLRHIQIKQKIENTIKQPNT